jgi:hypothetical protein
VDLLDEVGDERLGDVEVGDDAVAHRPDGDDVAGRLSDHFLRGGADGLTVQEDFVRSFPHGHDRRLRQDDALSADVDQRVAGPEIHPHVLGEDPEAAFDDPPHGSSLQQWRDGEIDQEMKFSRSPSHEPSLYPDATGVEQSIADHRRIANKIQIIIYNLCLNKIDRLFCLGRQRAEA